MVSVSWCFLSLLVASLDRTSPLFFLCPLFAGFASNTQSTSWPSNLASSFAPSFRHAAGTSHSACTLLPLRVGFARFLTTFFSLVSAIYASIASLRESASAMSFAISVASSFAV